MSSTPRCRRARSRRRRGAPTGPGWPACASCCTRPESSTPQPTAAALGTQPRAALHRGGDGRPDPRRPCCATSGCVRRCCGPKSVESLINDLLPFAEYLTAHHPQLTSLRELDRACIEGYLAWNRTRGWRGQRAAAGAGRTVSAAVAQSAVLSLRNLLDDITAWGWAAGTAAAAGLRRRRPQTRPAAAARTDPRRRCGGDERRCPPGRSVRPRRADRAARRRAAGR